MALSNFEDRVRKLITLALSEPQRRNLSPASNLQDLGLNSLAIVMLLFELEKEFGVSLADSVDQLDLSTVRTVADLTRVAHELLATRGAA